MSDTVGDYLLERLSTWGIKRIYGYPGDGINGIMGAFSRSSNGRPDGHRPDFVQVRHEEMAALMACAHAKFTGELGVCMATSGPGAVHLLNGLYDAKLDHQPVLAIVGQQARAGLGGNYQQEIDLQTLFKDVAHEFVEVAMVPEQIRHLVDRACRIALAERSVTALIIPNDLQEADALGAGVAKALLGKAALPDDVPYVTGSIGARHQAELDADAGVRQAADGRLELPVLGVSA
ncbi:MAG TPA: thiamine pyrophosphate-binding protein [Solirubrobacteraceae bacterium]|nr:thiamine pyrophosphate-binding protein [Solirubrobacteraceae bacterium]